MEVKNKLSSAHQAALHLYFSLALQCWQCLCHKQASLAAGAINRVPSNPFMCSYVNKKPPKTITLSWRNSLGLLYC